MAYQASEEGPALPPHADGFAAKYVLRCVDATLASLQRIRNRIEQPAEDKSDDRHYRKKAEDTAAVAAPDAAPRASPRLRRFLLVALMLAVAGLAGMTSSYRLLSHALSTKDSIIEMLEDEIAQLEKEDARTVNDKAKYQKQVYESEKEILALQQEIDDGRAEIEELRNQIAALRGTGGGYAAGEARRTPVPQKSATCTTGGARTASDLTRCLQEFNRK